MKSPQTPLQTKPNTGVSNLKCDVFKSVTAVGQLKFDCRDGLAFYGKYCMLHDIE